MKPFLKWVGGKRQLLPIIKQYTPKQFNIYYEPFLGSAAVLFDLQPKNFVINDLNEELINCYYEIRDDLDNLISYLNTFQDTEAEYYRIRNFDRDPNINYQLLSNAFKAARFIYLNKTGFNGLCRYNSKGQFNVPYGSHKSKFKPDIETLIEINNFLNKNNNQIRNVDFEIAVEDARKNDFVYIDSPYWPISETSNFTSYIKDGFTMNDQIRLRDCFKELTERGCYCLLSNSDTEFIKNLYKDFNIIEVQAKRNINCDGNKRGKISEVLIMNYNNQTTS